MKLTHLFLVLFIAYAPFNQALPLKKNKEETYYAFSGDNYIYIDLHSFSSSDSVYLMLECDNGDIQQLIYYGYTDSDTSTSTTDYKNPSSTVTTTINSDQTKTYYYSLSYKNYNYMVVRFTNSYYYRFNMKLKATDSDPVSSLVTIILAVVFSIVGLAIIIVVIVCVCICRRRRTVGMVGGPATYAPMAPQTPLVNPNQPYPQAAPMY